MGNRFLFFYTNLDQQPLEIAVFSSVCVCVCVCVMKIWPWCDCDYDSDTAHRRGTDRPHCCLATRWDL